MPDADEIDAQLQRIAQMLREARAPLIYGLTQLTVEAQELAVELAMCLRGAIDTPRGSRIPPRGTSMQLYGEVRTTLGELRQYADLLVFVGCEPTAELSEFFAVKGSKSLPVKQCLQLKEVSRNIAGLEAQVRELGCRNMDEVETLRKKLKHLPVNDSSKEKLLKAWQAAKYPVLVYDPEHLGTRSYLIEQLERAALARTKYGRAAAWPLDKVADQLNNAAGAEYVLTARTGSLCAVQFFSGCAEYLPGISDAYSLFTQNICDVVLNLGEYVAPWWTEACYSTKQLLISARCAPRTDFFKPLIFLPCRSLEHETSGTILREDGVPFSLPLSEEAKKSWSLNTESMDSLEEGEGPEAGKNASYEDSKTAPRMEDILHRLLELLREPAAAAPGAAR